MSDKSSHLDATAIEEMASLADILAYSWKQKIGTSPLRCKRAAEAIQALLNELGRVRSERDELARTVSALTATPLRIARDGH